MCRTTYSSFQCSNTLNNTGIELASLYTVSRSAVNGLSRLTTMSNGQAQPIRKFSNRSITFESNRNGRFEFESNLEALQVPSPTGHRKRLYRLSVQLQRKTNVSSLWPGAARWWPPTVSYLTGLLYNRAEAVEGFIVHAADDDDWLAGVASSRPWWDINRSRSSSAGRNDRITFSTSAFTPSPTNMYLTWYLSVLLSGTYSGYSTKQYSSNTVLVKLLAW